MWFARANKRQSGQALIEYMMVLLFTLIICMGAFYQFNDAFKQYVSSYFGAYLSCLLETGELPALGYEGPAQTDTCNGEFQPFSLANGRPLRADPGSGTPVAEGGGVPAQRGRSGSGPVKESGGVAPSSGGVASGPMAERSYAGNSNIPAGGGPSLMAGGNGGITKVPLSNVDKAGGKRSGAQDNSLSSNDLFDDGKSGRRPVVPMAENEQYDGKAKAKTSIPAGDQNIDSLQKRLISAETAKKAMEVKEEEMSFSDFIKYLLIAVLVIAMVIFFGGQALQISKSGEK